MGKKRKLSPKPAQSVQSQLKQQQQQSQFHDEEAEYEFAHQEYKEQPQEEEAEEDYQEQEEEVEDEEEEYQECEEEEPNDHIEEEEPNDHIQNAYDQTANSLSTSSPNYDEEEPIQKLLEPLGKDEIARLLCDAATKHRDVGDWIRAAADVDPAHRKIFVHGLGWDTTAETLSAAFRQYGEIEDCKAVTDKITGKSKGYGFILFRTRRGARNALRQPQKKIGNRTTACQLASVGPVQNNAVATAPTTPGVPEYTQRKIYVSNVGAELDLQRLLAFFSLFGEIEEGPLGLDKVTGKPKGFCFFVYKSVESAKRALVEPHKNFEGHVLHCQRANDGSKQQRLVMQGNSERNVATAQLQRNENHGFVGGMAGAGHLMAQGRPVFGGVAVTQTMNPVPAIGQALKALLASPSAASLQLNGMFGIGSPVAAVNSGGHGGYGSQGNLGATVIGGYGNQVGLQGAYRNQQPVGQVGFGRWQQQQHELGVGQYGGVAPYMGH